MTLDKLIFEKNRNSFEARFSFANESCSITLCDFSEAQKIEATDLAERILNWLDNNIEKSKLFAANQLIELKNGNWLEEDEEPINEITFANRIKVDGIIAFLEGGFEIYFNDGDIFWGHLIRVCVDKECQLNNANIAG